MPPDIQVTITPVVAGPTVVISPVVSGPALVISEGVQGLTGPQGVQGPVGAASTVPGPQGIKGDPGERGDRGIQGEVGPAPWRLVGPYDNGMDYGLGDAVTYQGGFYYRTGNPLNPGYPPEPGVINASWTPVADRGAVGPQGVPGQNGSDASVTSANITTALGYTPDNPSAERTPTAHTHTKSQITDFTHAHAITDVTGLQTALDGKTPTAHTHTKSQITDFTHAHAITDVTGLQTALDGKTPTAHTHTKSQITDFPTLATVATSGSYADLSSKPSIPAAQVNSDWNATSGVAEILNKPSIPSIDQSLNTTDDVQFNSVSATEGFSAPVFFAGELTTGAQLRSDATLLLRPSVKEDWEAIKGVVGYDSATNNLWYRNSPTGFTKRLVDADYLTWGNLLSKPSFSTVATSGSYEDLSNKPTIPAATTDASLLTSGTLSDSRLSENVSLDNQNNNFSASQTFAGSANTAPNQTAASGSSLMTRDLGDSRYLSQPYQLTPAAPGTIAGTNVSYGPFNVVRSDQTWVQGFGSNNVPGVCVPYFFNGSKAISNFALNHTAGTNPTAILEVGLYQANATTNLPDAYIGKVSFPLNATGKKVQTLGSSVTLRGLVWAVIRPTLGDTAFKATGNGTSLSIAAFSQQSHQATYLSFLFGYGPIADGVTNFHGYMNPSRSSSFAFSVDPLPTSSILSQIVIAQGGPYNSNAPMVLLY